MCAVFEGRIPIHRDTQLLHAEAMFADSTSLAQGDHWYLVTALCVPYTVIQCTYGRPAEPPWELKGGLTVCVESSNPISPSSA